MTDTVAVPPASDSSTKPDTNGEPEEQAQQTQQAQQTASDMFGGYEWQRRLRLAGVLLPIFAPIQFLLAILSIVIVLDSHFPPPLLQIGIFTSVIIALGFVSYVAGIYFVRKQRTGPAILCLIIPACATILLPVPLYDFAYRLSAHVSGDPIVAVTLNIVIATFALLVLVGLLASNRWQLVGATILLNLFTVGIMLFALRVPGMGTSMGQQAQMFIPLPLMVQWTVAGILIASMDVSLRTIRELGEVRVAYAQAQQLDDLKDQFITHINHELRSPVMAMQGHIELLLLTGETLTPEERTSYLEHAKHAGDTLSSLVMSILDIRRIEQEAGTLVPEPVPVKAAVEAAAQLIDPREATVSGRELRIDIPESLAIWGDPVRLRQILINLLSNAVKYSAPETPVKVTARLVTEKPAASARRSGQQSQRLMAEITVRDYGLGIPPEQIPLLFKRFVRLPRDLASNVVGNGLGLHLCQLFAEEMGGSIWVESSGVEGEGSTFHVQLPLPPAGIADVTNASASATDGAGI